MSKEVKPPKAPKAPEAPKMLNPQEQLKQELVNLQLKREGMIIVAQAFNKEMLLIEQSINQLSKQLTKPQND